MKHTLLAPLRLPKNRKKDFIFNLNVYRITHYRTLNTMKIRYKEFMRKQITALPKMDKVIIDYVLYPKTKRRTDLGNVLSIHQKFCEDALVEIGCLVDDDYHHILESRFRFGYVDKENPRVEIIITEIK